MQRPHLLHLVAFVVVEASAHANHSNTAQVAEDHLASVSLDRGLGEVRNVLERNPFDDIDLVAQQSQSCSANNTHLRGKVWDSQGIGDFSSGLVAESVKFKLLSNGVLIEGQVSI